MDVTHTAQYGLRTPGRAGGFSLVELLTIIVIIGLLLSIATPTLLKVHASFLSGQTQATIALLDGACEMYAEDFEQVFPPSHWADASSPLAEWEGRHLLPLLLVGYAADKEPYGRPSDDLSQDDGADGPGFRTLRRGKVYGPYNGAAGAPTITESPGGDDRIAFADSFKQAIYYYRFDVEAGKYQDSHNTGLGNINEFVKDPDNGDKYFRTNFVLLAPGPDTKFRAYSDGTDGRVTDDNTNFLPE